MTVNNQSSHAILFVDDEEKARKMFTRLVSPQFTVLTAADVKEAKEVLDQNHNEIGVLITDQRMPGELGVDLLRHVRKEFPKIIRMLTTAYTDLDDAIEAVNTGEIFRYINKPWNADELLIDLRLAMNFFDIEQDRSQLIQEKMSMSHRQSRMESLKNLLTMSASQSHYSCPKQAVRSFLLQTVDAQKSAENTIEIDSSGFWEGEINKTEKMIRINTSLNQWSDQALSYIGSTESIDYQASADQASKALSVTCALELADVSQNSLNQQGINALFNVIFQTLATSDLKMAISNNDNNIQISCSSASPADTFAKQLVTVENETGDQHTGELLAVFLLINHIGGKVKLGFTDANLMNVEVVLPQKTEAGECKDIEGTIWIEDLFVLYN